MTSLTNTFVGKIAPPETGKTFIYDSHRDAPPGFALKITSAGSKIFTLRYKVDGRQRMKVIGEWPTWSVESARSQGRALVQAVDRGDDPLEDERKRRTEPTISELAEKWLDLHASGLVSEQAIRGYVNNDIIPAIGKMKVSDVSRRDVIELVEKKAKNTPRAAAQVLLYARRLMDYATDREFIPANPLAGLKPSSIQVKGKRNPLQAKARERILDHSEIRQFWAKLDTAGFHLFTALALKLILTTGARPGEVAGLRWDEIEANKWTIPAERRRKNDMSHTVHLTPTALGILDAARAEAQRLFQRRGPEWKGEYAFELRAGKPIRVSGLDRAVERAGWGDWRPHDLRRTMRTGLSACRIRPDIAELTIGHSKKGIIAVYDRHEFEDERQEAMEKWEAYLLGVISG